MKPAVLLAPSLALLVGCGDGPSTTSTSGTGASRPAAEICADTATVTPPTVLADVAASAVAFVGGDVFATVVQTEDELDFTQVARIHGGALDVVQPDGAQLASLVSDAGHAYYAVRGLDTRILKVAPGGAPTELFTAPVLDMGFSSSLAVDDQRVYVGYHAGMEVTTVLLGTGTPTGGFQTLATLPPGELVGPVASDGTHLYAVTVSPFYSPEGPGTLWKVPVSGGTPTTVTEDVGGWLAANASGVYYAQRDPTTHVWTLVHLPPDGPAAPLWTFGPDEQPAGLALASDAVYVRVLAPGATEIVRVPLEGGCRGLVGRFEGYSAHWSYQPLAVGAGQIIWADDERIMTAPL